MLNTILHVCAMLKCLRIHAWIQLNLVACEGRAAGAPDILQASPASGVQTLTSQLNASALSGFSLASSCSILMHWPSNSSYRSARCLWSRISSSNSHSNAEEVKLVWDQLWEDTTKLIHFRCIWKVKGDVKPLHTSTVAVGVVLTDLSIHQTKLPWYFKNTMLPPCHFLTSEIT